MKIDVLKRRGGKILIGEIKKSSKGLKAGIMQLAFYLYQLKKQGIILEGELLIPKERKRIPVKLNSEIEAEIEKTIEKVKEICHILKSTVCIFQTPPSFKYTQENLNNVITFFTTISRDNINIGWEPRGDWNKPEYRTQLRKLFEEIDVCHVVDPLRREPVYTTNISYFRLHGLGGREVNYKYKYTNEDLRKLYTIVQKYMDTKDIVYVMFNNVFMSEDALRFKSYFQE